MKNNKRSNFNFLITKKNTIKNVHFIGIGGISMSGIAEILFYNGYEISGSDILSTHITKKLTNLGIKVFLNHSKKNVLNTDVIIVSSAISKNNPEIIQAKSLNIPIIPRGKMLAEIIKHKYGIAISGTHGKTTTTAMIFSIFLKSKFNPTIINGGYIKEINNNIKLGTSPYYIIEADESDASLLYLKPVVIVITNINNDHLENYNKKFENLKSTFIKFIQNLPFYGTAIVCIDDNNIKSILPLIRCNVITYGFSSNSDIRIDKYKQLKYSSYFIIIRRNKPILKIVLNMPGKHNALNATAAIAIATKENISDDNILKSLRNFQGIERRFELCGKFSINNLSHKSNTITIIKDYGHHPSEISASISTAKSGWPNKKLIMIFQPHRYTRTHYLFEQFIETLLKVDELIILKEYSAHEKKILGSDSISLYKKLIQYQKISVTLISHYTRMFSILLHKLSGNDLLLVQGAGDINFTVNQYIIKNLKKLKKNNFYD
ncbi:MAG: UDP-N-acetylmuramate--L-alanine ligase [Buchnera aphidicola (Schlechtendalia peitan)]